jgi:hypothetical protein
MVFARATEIPISFVILFSVSDSDGFVMVLFGSFLGQFVSGFDRAYVLSIFEFDAD